MTSFTILGASGFLGGAITKVAHARGHDARAVARSRSKDDRGRSWMSVVDYHSTPRARSDDEILVHLAQANLQQRPEDSRSALALVHHLHGLGYRQVCYASSAAVYGDQQEHAHRVDELPVATSPYATLKLDCERTVLAAGGSCARFANIYGIEQSPASVLARILAQIPGAGPLKLRSLTPIRDFCWVEDAAEAVVEWCSRGLTGIFNVGSGAAVSIHELALRALAVASEPDREIVAEEVPVTNSTLRVDITATTNRCEWFPRTNLDTGLQRMIRNNL